VHVTESPELDSVAVEESRVSNTMTPAVDALKGVGAVRSERLREGERRGARRVGISRRPANKATTRGDDLTGEGRIGRGGCGRIRREGHVVGRDAGSSRHLRGDKVSTSCDANFSIPLLGCFTWTQVR
jgi:hypothetical protein